MLVIKCFALHGVVTQTSFISQPHMEEFLTCIILIVQIITHFMFDTHFTETMGSEVTVNQEITVNLFHTNTKIHMNKDQQEILNL